MKKSIRMIIVLLLTAVPAGGMEVTAPAPIFIMVMATPTIIMTMTMTMTMTTAVIIHRMTSPRTPMSRYGPDQP